MRLAFSGDLQCFSPSYNWDTEAGLPSRLEEWQGLWAQLLVRCQELGAQALVHPGDLFHLARPAPATLLAVLGAFREAEEEQGLPIYGCLGNHDVVGLKIPGGADIVSFYKPNWAIGQPRVILLGAQGVALAFLPYLPTSVLAEGSLDPAEAAQAAGEQLLLVAEGLRAEVPAGLQAVLIAHWTLQGAARQHGGYRVWRGASALGVQAPRSGLGCPFRGPYPQAPAAAYRPGGRPYRGPAAPRLQRGER